MQALNLVGEPFGRLIVRERVGSKGGKSYWLCDCECGGTVKAIASDLRRKNVTSCGCYRREFIRGNQLAEGESGFNGLYSRYRGRAKKYDIPFNLTKEEFRVFTKERCFYCGVDPSQSISSLDTGRSRYIYNGVDRLDSDKGYSVDNCVSACSTCNYMKLDMSVSEFISSCQNILQYQNQKGTCLEQVPS